MGSEDTTKRFDDADPNRLPAATADLERRLSALEKKFDERGYDTRPVFEAHEKRLVDLEKVISDLKGKGVGPLKFEHLLYWIEGDNIPFCPHCYESNPREQRHLQPGNDVGKHWCSKCKNHYQDARYEKPSNSVSFRHPIIDEFD